MDRGLLSQPEVIAASRQFVCIRVPTYEDKSIEAFSQRLYVGRSGNVENTTFALLSPNAEQNLVRAGRSPQDRYATPAEMAKGLQAIAAKYPVNASESNKTPPLPVAADVRLAVNIAASDRLPLVVVVAANEQVRAALESKMAGLAWSDEFLGQFIYATAASSTNLESVTGAESRDGVLLLEPDKFGQDGRVVKQLAADVSSEQLAAAMRTVIAAHQKAAKDSRTHRAEGERAGAFWETKLSIGDPHEVSARERTKAAIQRIQPGK